MWKQSSPCILRQQHLQKSLSHVSQVLACGESVPCHHINAHGHYEAQHMPVCCSTPMWGVAKRLGCGVYRMGLVHSAGVREAGRGLPASGASGRWGGGWAPLGSTPAYSAARRACSAASAAAVAAAWAYHVAVAPYTCRPQLTCESCAAKGLVSINVQQAQQGATSRETLQLTLRFLSCGL